jgi:endothelin-converting enzyme
VIDPSDELSSLLGDDHLREEDGEAQYQPAPSPGPEHRIRRFLSATHHHSRRASHTSRKALARNARHILIACLLALLTLFASIWISFFLHHKFHKKTPTCQSSACVHAASEILYNLDPNHAKLDACTDFDAMVCGGWLQRHDLRSDQGDMFTGTNMAENSKIILCHILEQSSLSSFFSSADQGNFKKLKDDYDSCMNENKLQKIGLQSLQGIADRIKMSFPAIIDLTGQSVSPKLEGSS